MQIFQSTTLPAIDARLMVHPDHRPFTMKGAVAHVLSKMDVGEGVRVGKAVNCKGRELGYRELCAIVSGLSFIAKFSVMKPLPEESHLGTIWCLQRGPLAGAGAERGFRPESDAEPEDTGAAVPMTIDARGRRSMNQAIGDILATLEIGDTIYVKDVINRDGKSIPVDSIRAAVSRFNSSRCFYSVKKYGADVPHGNYVATITAQHSPTRSPTRRRTR
jgi:hypothetical protein